MRKLALTSAAAALVLALVGVVAISATSQAAEPGAHKSKTLTFDVVFSPFSPIAANNVRDPNSDFAPRGRAGLSRPALRQGQAGW